jgi:hypothetical protein
VVGGVRDVPRVLADALVERPDAAGSAVAVLGRRVRRWVDRVGAVVVVGVIGIP